MSCNLTWSKFITVAVEQFSKWFCLKKKIKEKVVGLVFFVFVSVLFCLFVCWDIVTSCCSASSRESCIWQSFSHVSWKQELQWFAEGFYSWWSHWGWTEQLHLAKGAEVGEKGGEGGKVLWKAPQRLCSKILLASLEPCVLHRWASHGKTVNVKVQSVHLNFIVWALVFPFWGRGAAANSEMSF